MILAILVKVTKKHFWEIILKLRHWSRRRCHLKVFLFLALAAILFSGNFARGSPEEYFVKLF